MNKMTAVPKVFVSQDNDQNYTSARKFGELVFLSDRELLPYSGSAQNRAIAHGIESGITKDYTPGFDYLLPSGGMLSIAHMYRAAFRRGAAHKILKWDRQSQSYNCYEMKGK